MSEEPLILPIETLDLEPPEVESPDLPVQQTMEDIDIDGYKGYEKFTIEVPQGWEDNQVKKYLGTLDLDALLGVPKGDGVGTTDLTFITAHENAASAGLRDGKWHKFNNAAGNNEVNIGAGSVKLTADELASGTVSIGGKEVDFTGGITSEQSDALAKERITSAESIALASLVKVGMNLDKDKVTALTSLIYNVGAGAWAESRAKKFLEAGNIEDFMHEAFSEESGWVHIAGKKSKGLIRRRAAEAERFGHTQVAEGDTQGAFAFLSDKLNPISKAHATEAEAALSQEAKAAKSSIETQGPRFPSPTRKPEMPTQGADLGPEALRDISPGRKPDPQAVFKDKPRLQQVFDGDIGIFEAAGDAILGEIAAATFDKPELAKPGFVSALVKGPNARILARGVLGHVSKEIGLPEFITEVFYGETLFGPISESFLSKDEINSLRGVVLSKVKDGKPGEKGAFTYTDQKGGAADFAYSGSSFVDKQTDPDFRVKATLGSGNWFIDERGHIIVEDIFNSNDGLALQKKYPLFSDRFKNLIEYSKEKNVGAYGVIRRFAALFGPPGSPNAEYDTQGPKFKIDLGPVVEDMSQSR